MRRIGCLVLILAALGFLGSCSVFTVCIGHAYGKRRVEAKPLVGGRAEFSAVLSTERMGQLAIAMTVRIPRALSAPNDPAGFVPVYRFPVRCQVRDAADAIVLEADTELRADRGSRTMTQQSVDRSVGMVAVEHRLARFPVPAGGGIRVGITLGRDVDGAATAEGVAIIVYDRVADDGPLLAAGFVLLAGSVIAVLMGVVLTIVGRSTSRG